MRIKEIVLPSGRFATFRPIQVRDILISLHREEEMQKIALISMVMLLDGEPVKVETIMEMEISDFAPILEIIHTDLEAAGKFKQGVK